MRFTYRRSRHNLSLYYHIDQTKNILVIEIENVVVNNKFFIRSLLSLSRLRQFLPAIALVVSGLSSILIILSILNRLGVQF